jgi:hypothetical protein
VSAGYFAAMGWTLEDGRLFGDDLARGCRVGVVNQEAAERYFGGKAVGTAVIDQAGRRTEIVESCVAGRSEPFSAASSLRSIVRWRRTSCAA